MKLQNMQLRRQGPVRRAAPAPVGGVAECDLDGRKAAEMVLLGRIELPTSALPRMRSTTELQQRTISRAWPAPVGVAGQGRAIAASGRLVKRGLPEVLHSSCPARHEHRTMSEPNRPLTREERLAAQLRANLRRRKTQARALADGAADPEAGDEGESGVSPSLPKSPSGG